MIQKLRRQFILVAMGSTLAVLIVIIGTLNVLNYHVMTSRKDDILEILSSNNGEFPEAFGQKRNFEDAPPEPPENDGGDVGSDGDDDGGEKPAKDDKG